MKTPVPRFIPEVFSDPQDIRSARIPGCVLVWDDINGSITVMNRGHLVMRLTQDKGEFDYTHLTEQQRIECDTLAQVFFIHRTRIRVF